jgi:hypothetical protein
MGLQSGRVAASPSISGPSDSGKKKLAYVYDVILDETNEYSKNRQTFSSTNGAIRFKTSDSTLKPEQLPIAYPSDKVYKSIPIRNELVEVYEVTTGYYVYRRMGKGINPSQSGNETAISLNFIPEPGERSNVTDYQNVEATGITGTSQNESKKFDGYGKYYQPQNNLHNLKLYEGDTLIESRFGQSIRFSGFNNSENVFSPTTIIRNGESPINRKVAATNSVDEDINRDGSSIVMSSEKYQLPFQPGTVDDKGKSDFLTKPDSFEDFPTKLIGDNILINSGRIILSAKNAEMIFYSKKNYGFISDGAMSIDNKLGIDVSVGDNINILTNDKDIVMYTGNGSIFLGSKDLEPLVKGQQLVDILSELIDTITLQTFLTPSGPTAVGPTNLPDFGAIKSKLNNILSKLNQTS